MSTVILHAVAVLQVDQTLEEKDAIHVLIWYHII